MLKILGKNSTKACVKQISSSTTTKGFLQMFTTQPGLYPTHTPTSPLQKIILGAGSAVVAISDPWRADMVAVNGEVTGLPALHYMHSRMADSKEGIRILTDKPRIKSDILPNLLNLPPNSLGHNYASFMKRNKISPDSR